MEFNPAEVIFRFGEPAKHLYGVLEGEVNLSVVFKDKVLKTEIRYEEAIQSSIVEEEKSIVVDKVLPGQIFGWAVKDPLSTPPKSVGPTVSRLPSIT